MSSPLPATATGGPGFVAVDQPDHGSTTLRRTLIGVGTLIVILHVIGLAVAVAWLTVRPPGL